MKGDISPQLPGGTLLFTGYENDQISINRKPYQSGLYIHDNVVTAPWGPARLSELTADQLSPLLEPAPEVLILGTGRQTAFPSAEIMEFVSSRKIGLECMDSRSAARTYNILIEEGRTVSAALLLPNARR
ncbi:NADH dehydrogenase [ubiquinone] 1 alpha subcomplex assembly factor 3 [Mariprofundus aestuarium]|uniref:NADH dehydrogenase [ubiquinone] 1 alpha subcomplex assembly factor 3 n=1 Tax=Mariprofundus aestuarium TaxID=1921086 RepID=A0A2K8KYK6_MARES|nr:MTH938/NDUFAF3 family protein [Mariprofundus aestuarium]ATX80003.1 NADH dehydrogenase [ubiquinone] 1 alpha subcomplex assembly factor 3 [Mariprofundus aestuarium]